MIDRYLSQQRRQLIGAPCAFYPQWKKSIILSR